MSVLIIVALVVSLEVVLIWMVTVQRRRFQWLITRQDEQPVFDLPALEKFFDYSFDSGLGWVRKPNSTGTEQGQKGTIKFAIDSTGSRVNRFNLGPSVVAAFGDSYTFCRQVEDDETWEAQLAEHTGFGVLNFGVGNYGLDQALLRYEDTRLPDEVKVVIMGFVPETICRIQSCWKHYLEFGNTFAFKPRFALRSTDGLRLVKNPVQSIDDFLRLPDYLPEIRENDRFYKTKFRPLQYRFPYTLSLLRNPLKQIPLIFALTLRGLFRIIGVPSQWAENLPFTQVMRNNIREAHELYSDPDSTNLLLAICRRFNSIATAKGHIPLLLIMPQLLDLRAANNIEAKPYQKFFAQVAQQMPVIDVSDEFMKRDFEQLYINDQYGGHLAVAGNRLVAEIILSWLGKHGVVQTQ